MLRAVTNHHAAMITQCDSDSPPGGNRTRLRLLGSAAPAPGSHGGGPRLTATATGSPAACEAGLTVTRVIFKFTSELVLNTP